MGTEKYRHRHPVLARSNSNRQIIDYSSSASSRTSVCARPMGRACTRPINSRAQSIGLLLTKCLRRRGLVGALVAVSISLSIGCSHESGSRPSEYLGSISARSNTNMTRSMPDVSPITSKAEAKTSIQNSPQTEN